MEFQDHPADPEEYLPSRRVLRQRALARAWDEGYNAGCADGEVGDHVTKPTPNPYREES